MTIPTPISNPLPAPDAVPQGLPDVAALTSLASQFFAALPGAAGNSAGHLPSNPVPANPQPAGFSPGPLANGPALPGTFAPGANAAPANPQDGAAVLASTPSLAPKAAATNGLPDHAAIVPPALNGRFGGHSLGVPQVSPRTAPTTDSASPFYFLADATPYAPQSKAQDVPREDLVSARSFGLPGADDLRALLADNRAPARATPASQPQRGAFDVHAVRRDFPILQERVNGRQLVWFDNAATTQKPRQVIERVSYFYEHENSNIHRAAHELAARATDAYENARESVRRFINAPSVNEVIFTRGTTEAINLIAKSWGARNIGEGDEIIVSNLEHHANIVPWQQLAWAVGAKIRVIPVDDDGQVILSEYQRLLGPKVKLVAVTQVSNALGTVVPVKEIVDLAHRNGSKALVDGAQSISHMRVDVQDIGADFFVFSGHKIFGPTGIGAVWARAEILDDMPPWQGGGNMIEDVTFERTRFQPAPNKFEAGTGNIADAVGLGAALEYVEGWGIENIGRYEHELLDYATQLLRPIKGVRLVGTARDKASVLSFTLEGYTTHEVGVALNEEGISVRTGHHCAQPILRRFGLETTVRPSLAFYNTRDEVDRFIAVVQRLSKAPH
ncbi:family 2A encapsulin nanocompartment cargo protein cysteine desulfurase [Rhodobacter sp. 24-YEA-8]|uniref:family 2A encapsulin nanocompartment cargo protein cysteine desulfurase n=1 Tax=Rhodobacter sp. 24-YEA-8 TaxID=1884310 RepID=UPI00089501AD|nr:family 2A encapsulin nanocompartment cargo protein cysteine desulfurase [Rhodobacter sp. 24-YEA-8]SED21313.1 cysteine desulfurase / selenocysteine lyase [Rhodobacter sp. 24-YEA-8]